MWRSEAKERPPATRLAEIPDIKNLKVSVIRSWLLPTTESLKFNKGRGVSFWCIEPISKFSFWGLVLVAWKCSDSGLLRSSLFYVIKMQVYYIKHRNRIYSILLIYIYIYIYILEALRAPSWGFAPSPIFARFARCYSPRLVVQLITWAKSP